MTVMEQVKTLPSSKPLMPQLSFSSCLYAVCITSWTRVVLTGSRDGHVLCSDDHVMVTCWSLLHFLLKPAKQIHKINIDCNTRQYEGQKQ